MEGRIAAILDGGDCDIGVESTVVDLCHTPPRLLRPGGITPEMLEGDGLLIRKGKKSYHRFVKK